MRHTEISIHGDQVRCKSGLVSHKSWLSSPMENSHCTRTDQMESTVPRRMLIFFQDVDQDPLCPIVAFPLPVPVLVPFPYSMNKPLVLDLVLGAVWKVQYNRSIIYAIFPVPVQFLVPLPVPVPFKFYLNKSLLYLSLNVLFHSIHFVFFIVRIVDTETQVCRSYTLRNLS